MKYSIALIVLFSSFLANAQTCTNCTAQADTAGNCQILPPNTKDANARHCSGTSFGVTYLGTLIVDQCFPSFREAQDYMRGTPACTQSNQYGNCKILNPNTRDTIGHICPGTQFGITYKGYRVDEVCYSTLQRAMNYMYASQYCTLEDSIGECKVLYSGASDNNSRHCTGTRFGVTYKGYLTKDVCYASIAEALSELYTEAN